MAFFIFSFLLADVLVAQQVADTAFTYPNKQPRYAAGTGSVIWLDEAHNNFHTLDGRYAAFGKIVRQDGYRIEANRQMFTVESLKSCKILVIANALDASNNNGSWQLPNPSAFSAAEIAAVNAWVRDGGRLLLIADHMPFAGAAEALGRSFGVEFVNCFAFDNRRRALERFYAGNGLVGSHPIVQGRQAGEKVDTVITFTGSAFKLPPDAQPILTLKNYSLLLPEIAWQFDESTAFLPGDDYCQAASLNYGRGKLVVFGEAAMFSAQLAGPNQNRVGLNLPDAVQNNRLLINILHWLDMD